MTFEFTILGKMPRRLEYKLSDEIDRTFRIKDHDERHELIKSLIPNSTTMYFKTSGKMTDTQAEWCQHNCQNSHMLVKIKEKTNDSRTTFHVVAAFDDPDEAAKFSKEFSVE